MREKNISRLWLIFLVPFTLVSCGTVVVHNVKGCSVAGVIQAGADCAESLTQKKSEMTFEEYVTFLEAGAIAFSVEDVQEMKTALDQACQKITCEYEVQSLIESLDYLINKNKEAKNARRITTIREGTTEETKAVDGSDFRQ